ncbi:MAG: hypothetical protein LBI31_03045 [Zoogloeaceae bacterium]|jgi:hypothetical protein|nr:hypothetical protein [Zoogloeaceae bacterium]
MKTSLFLSALMVAVGVTVALFGQREWAREEDRAREARLRLDALRQNLARQEEDTTFSRNEALRQKLAALLAEGFFRPPAEANFQVFGNPEGQEEVRREESREAENGVSTGFIAFTWQVRHMADFVSSLSALQSGWRSSSTPAPAPLMVEQCRFARMSLHMGQSLSATCKARWQVAVWPGEKTPEYLPKEEKHTSPDISPRLGRLFFTPEERDKLDREARKAEGENDSWQGMVRRERTGKSIIWKDGFFRETQNAAPEEVGGTTRDLLRGGDIRKDGGKKK